MVASWWRYGGVMVALVYAPKPFEGTIGLETVLGSFRGNDLLRYKWKHKLELRT